MSRLHKHSGTPKKKPKGGTSAKEEKAENRRIARERILTGNINAKTKAFKITAHRYRNRLKCYALRMALTWGILNFERR